MMKDIFNGIGAAIKLLFQLAIAYVIGYIAIIMILWMLSLFG